MPPYLFGCLDGHKVIVDLLRLGSHLLGLDALVIFASQPELEVLVVEFPFEECSIQSGSIYIEIEQRIGSEPSSNLFVQIEIIYE